MSTHPYYERRWHEDEKSRPRLSREAKENLCLIALAAGSIIGLALIWWLG